MPRLTETEFKGTIVPPPLARQDGDVPPFDFWPYVDSLPEEERQGYDFSAGRVSTAYAMAGDRWEHVLLDSDDTNVKLVVVLDLDRSQVHVHYLLNLNEVYGLDDR